MAKTDMYVYGNKNIPEWFTKACESGKIRIIKPDEEEEYLVISSGSKNYTAYKGYGIVKSIHGIAVIDKEQVKKYFRENNKYEQKANKENSYIHKDSSSDN